MPEDNGERAGSQAGDRACLIHGHRRLLEAVSYNEQSEILDELNEVVRSTEQLRLAHAAGALLAFADGRRGRADFSE